MKELVDGLFGEDQKYHTGDWIDNEAGGVLPESLRHELVALRYLNSYSSYSFNTKIDLD